MDTYLEPYKIRENTENFRKRYCFPYLSKNPRATVTNAEHINLRFDEMIKSYQGVDKQEIKRYIRSRYSGKLYSDVIRGFLSTFWWEVIRTKKKLDAGWKCTTEGCENDNGLCVHHKTYEHWGEELDYLDDLEVLCGDCHDIKHEKYGKMPHQPYEVKRRFRRKRKSSKRNGVNNNKPNIGGVKNHKYVVFEVPDEQEQLEHLKETEKHLQDFHDNIIVHKNKTGLVVVVESKTVNELWDVIDSQIKTIQNNLNLSEYNNGH